jgi:hypothetical protein
MSRTARRSIPTFHFRWALPRRCEMGASAVVGTRGSRVRCRRRNTNEHESRSDFRYAKDENLLRAQRSIYSNILKNVGMSAGG